MPYTPPTVNYAIWSGTSATTYYSLANVLSVNITRGRQRFQDNFSVSTATIELIPATSYTPTLQVGQYIDVRNANTSTSPAYFIGRISDIQRVYGMPYNTSTAYAPADRITITAVGATGNLASTQINFSAAAGNGLSTAVGTFDFCNVFQPAEFSAPTPTTISYNAYAGSAFDFVNTIARTIQYVISEADAQRVYLQPSLGSRDNYIAIHPAGQNWDTSYKFADTGAVNTTKFSQIEYLSSVENAFSQVVVNSDVVADQSASSGTTPFSALVYNAYCDTTTSAAALANYVLTMNSQTTAVPFRISTTTLLDENVTALGVLPTMSNPKSVIGRPVEITFRSATVAAAVQGISMAFYPDQCAVTLNLSPSLGQPFTLDNTAFGILDTSRLGFP